MSNKSWNTAAAWIIKAEGGYVNNPKDPGGETKYGIAKRNHPSLDIKNLSREAALAIYRKDYWDAAGCDALPYPVDIAVFDCAVNCGKHKAIELLQCCVGSVRDGVLGPHTLAAIEGTSKLALLDHYLFLRSCYYGSLKGARYFIHGWDKRLLNLRNFIYQIMDQGK